MTNLHSTTIQTVASALRSISTLVLLRGGGNSPLRLTLALLALVAFVAIIAADFTPPASAQSEEQAGRIVARQLANGRVEFGWQPAGGERILPRSRYFPADAPVGRWLRSSPVEVGGVAIGRIEARRLRDGRIEFAFTPSDGERIQPRQRNFPTDALPNRWLRSSEITIHHTSPRYIAISKTCAIHESGVIECWGRNAYKATDAPDGSYTAVSVGNGHICAIPASGKIACWGRNNYGQSDAPPGRFRAVSVSQSHSCGWLINSGFTCWGDNNYGQSSYISPFGE